jgi:hypothetical protein
LEHEMFLRPDKKNVQSNNLFTMAEALQIARLFVGKGHINQVLAFGSLARSQHGHDLGLIFVVSGDVYFRDFMQLTCQLVRDSEKTKATFRDMRLRAFEQMWKQYAPNWGQCVHGREEALRSYMDFLVLPWSWRSRQDELRSVVSGDGHSISRIAEEAVVLATES